MRRRSRRTHRVFRSHFGLPRCRGGDGQRSRIYADGCYLPGGGTDGVLRRSKAGRCGSKGIQTRRLGHRYGLMDVPFSFGSCSGCSHISLGLLKCGGETLKLVAKYKLTTLMFQGGSRLQKTVLSISTKSHKGCSATTSQHFCSHCSQAFNLSLNDCILTLLLKP
jgi:hypothetical protein